MRFALIDDKRVEAQPKQKGLCPHCYQPVIAKCGVKKVNHWAHLSLTTCDRWWEPETEWHRNWKNNYPTEWQEKPFFDEQTGEKHIADIRTIHDLVIEFQHSAIKPEERISREQFYKNMLWVVDGTRLKSDYPRFHKGKNSLFFTNTNNDNHYHAEFPDEIFPSDWLGSSVPVIFDFLGLTNDSSEESKSDLWCLVPRRADVKTKVIRIKREHFINITNNYPSLFEPRPQQPSIPPLQPRIIQKIIFNNPNRVVRRGPLIDWIMSKQEAGKWKPKKQRKR